jgi:hypothetical protein
VAAQLAASQEGLSSMELVSYGVFTKIVAQFFAVTKQLTAKVTC